MILRPAVAADAAAMSGILAEIIAATGHDRKHDTAHVLATYIAHPADVLCTLALDADGAALGFQSLIRALPGNPYDAAPGHGVIGTHVSPRAHRRGVGAALFAASLAAARAAGLPAIEAAIARDNAPALAYYAAIGFVPARDDGNRRICILPLTRSRPRA